MYESGDILVSVRFVLLPRCIEANMSTLIYRNEICITSVNRVVCLYFNYKINGTVYFMNMTDDGPPSDHNL